MANFVFDPPVRLARDVTVRTLDSRTYNEHFDGFIVRKFNGGRLKIASGEIRPL